MDNSFKDIFNKEFNTGNIQKDLITFNIYNKEIGLNSNIKEDEYIKFNQFKNLINKGDK